MNAVALATPVALTEAQAGLWFAQRLAPDNPSFNTAHAVWIDGPLDVAAFVAAADQAAGEAEAFALRFAEGADGQPLQWHEPAHVPLLSVRDVSAEADAAAAARSLMQADRMSPVDPTRDRISQQVLLELGGQRWVWYLRVHHLAADGYGMALFTDRVCALYAGRMGEPLPGLAGVLADDAAYRADPRRTQAGQWWREHRQAWAWPARSRPVTTRCAGCSRSMRPSVSSCCRHRYVGCRPGRTFWRRCQPSTCGG
jgi:enterobactin synthetase component F